MPATYEWDPRKALLNSRKHGVSFVEAFSVFGDPLARIFDDAEHSDQGGPRDHHRSFGTGKTTLVCFTELLEGQIRIISARRVTKLEQHDYEENVTK